MNKVVLMGRLTRDPETRYSQSAEPVAVTRFTLAVNRRFKKDNEPDADFINCVSFGKGAEFIEKYFRKGQLVSVVGSIRVSSWEDQSGQKRWSTDVVVEEQYFAESKASFESSRSQFDNQPPIDVQPSAPDSYPKKESEPSGFTAITESIDDDDLPF